jgi:putative acetyltransferase
VVSVRNARLEDAPVLCAAEQEIARSAGYLVSQPNELRPEAFESLISALGDGRGCYLVAEEEGCIVGHAFLKPMELRAVCHVLQLTIAVHPGCSRRGIGTMLMNALADWARHAPAVQKVELLVRSTNHRARRLYARFGFVEEGRLRNRIRLPDGTFIDDVTMAWFPKAPCASGRPSRLVQTLVNIDVDDLERAIDFYTRALGLRLERRLFDGSVAEMSGTSSTIYLLAKPVGSAPSQATSGVRDYGRHWTPVHLDFEVIDVAAAVERAVAAGAKLEGGIESFDWGRQATLSDPFGHGFCVLQFTSAGYGASQPRSPIDGSHR